MTTRTKIAFLGLGAMGARMAAKLVGADIDLHVWSRSGLPEGFPSLARDWAPAPAAAVAGADLVIAMVADDHASRSVWLDSGALSCMRRGAIAVDCSTLTPAWVGKLAEHARDTGVGFVDAPVVGSRPQADAGNLVFLAGGEVSAIEAVRPTLLRMGSALHHLGPSPAGAVAKLFANALFITQVAALAELVAFAQHAKLELLTLAQALEALPLMSASAKGALSGILASSFTPMFPISLAAKDLRYVLAEASAMSTEAPVASAVSSVFERCLNRGLGAENLTAVAKLYLEA